MGITGHNSNEKIVGETVLYTGITNVKVVAINPTKEEKEALGLSSQTDPTYISTMEDGTKKVRIDFYVEDAVKNMRSKIAFFLEDKSRTSRDGGKTEWINNFGRSA